MGRSLTSRHPWGVARRASSPPLLWITGEKLWISGDKCGKTPPCGKIPPPRRTHFIPHIWGVISDLRHMLAPTTLRNRRPLGKGGKAHQLCPFHPQRAGDKKGLWNGRGGAPRPILRHRWGKACSYPHIPNPYDYDDLNESSLGIKRVLREKVYKGRKKAPNRHLWVGEQAVGLGTGMAQWPARGKMMKLRVCHP